MSSLLIHQLQVANAVTFQETGAISLGTDNQRERWAAGVLPEDELLTLARGELFKGLAEVPRWHSSEIRRELRAKLDKKKCLCPGLRIPDPVHLSPVYDVTVVGDLDAPEWERLKFIESAVKALASHDWIRAENRDPSITTFTHWATCPACENDVWLSGAKVTIPWAGRSLVREFRL